MRLFMGTMIDDRTAKQIGTAAQQFLHDRRWRMMPMTQWHVTVLFIGERTEQERSPIEVAMRSIADRTRPITLRNGRLVSIPVVDPKMLWIEFDRDPQLDELHLSLAKATRTRQSEHLPITPHITIARSRRSPSPVNPVVVLDELILDRLSLFRSELHPSGAVHQQLHTVPLLE